MTVMSNFSVAQCLKGTKPSLNYSFMSKYLHRINTPEPSYGTAPLVGVEQIQQSQRHAHHL